MTSLINIARKLKGDCCEHVVKYTGQEIQISGINAGIGNANIKVASISNQIKEITKVPSIMVALDANQYLLCRQAESLKDDNPLKDECLRIRLMLMLAISQMQTMLSIDKAPEELNAEIIAWVKQMNDLTKQCIEILRPAQKIGSKFAFEDAVGSSTKNRGLESEETLDTKTIPTVDKRKIVEIMKFQGVTDGEMQEAIKAFKTK